METVNEESSAILVVSFLDENGIAVTPASATYRIDAVPGGTIRGITNFTPSSSSHNIVLQPSDNKIIKVSKSSEIHLVTVTAILSTGESFTAVYRYYVVNFKYIP